MKIKFLKSAALDITWMRRYYKSVFPEGSQTARKNYHAARLAIMANPHIGHSVEYIIDARAYSISRTPFSFIYRVKDDVIEVVRVLDSRSEDSNMT